MAIITPVVNGVVQNQNDPTVEKIEDKTSLDKNAFLQLLVAEMQNQDPLEPTTNTEYISQLATFSSLEEMQNMTKSMDFFRASSLVGQEVYLKTVNAVTGSTDYVHGNVDYITYEGGKAMVSVNGNMYPLEDVDSVYDQKYSNAYDQALNWTVALNKLPGVNSVTPEDKEAILSLKEKLDSMSDYDKSFLTQSNKDKLEQLYQRLEAILNTKKDEDDTEGSATGSGSGSSTSTGSGSSSGASGSGSSSSAPGSGSAADGVKPADTTDNTAAQETVATSNNTQETDEDASGGESEDSTDSE